MSESLQWQASTQHSVGTVAAPSMQKNFTDCQLLMGTLWLVVFIPSLPRIIRILTIRLLRTNRTNYGSMQIRTLIKQ